MRSAPRRLSTAQAPTIRMTNPLPMHTPLATLDDDAWEDLLNFIEERRVIPIIGPELLKVETESGPRLLYEWVAEKLAGKLNVDTAQLPQPLVHRGDAGLCLRARRRVSRARPARAAQASDYPFRTVGPRQDVDPARRHRAAVAADGLLPGLRADRL